jgi:mitochondrial fission protein ELM1
MLGNRAGDTNQLLAIAEALEWSFELRSLEYNQLRKLPFGRSASLVSLISKARQTIQPPWPDLIIGAGYRFIPVARFVRRASGGRTRIVAIGNPRGSAEDLNLVITTPQYARDPAPNLLVLRFPAGNPCKATQPNVEELAFLRRHPSPRRLVAVGGPARNWSIDRNALADALATVEQRMKVEGGSVVVAYSPRTPKRLRRWLHDWSQQRQIALVSDFPRFGALLSECDEFLVTADSVSMLSEAILTGKPVGMIPIRQTLRGRLSHALARLKLKPHPRMDLRRFWRVLREDQLVGTPTKPRASRCRETTGIAVDAIRKLFDDAPNPREAAVKQAPLERQVRIWSEG